MQWRTKNFNTVLRSPSLSLCLSILAALRGHRLECGANKQEWSQPGTQAEREERPPTAKSSGAKPPSKDGGKRTVQRGGWTL